MDLYKEILSHMLCREELQLRFPQLEQTLDADWLVEMSSYVTLLRIKKILEDDTLSDFNCIEQIMHLFERMGSGCGTRHDF